MAEAIPADHPLRKLFRSAVDRAFQDFPEVYTPEVATHIGDNVLSDFVHVDRLYRLRNARGKPLEELPEMIQVACEKEGPERRLEVDRYIGDFVLFMAGFFPSFVRRSGWFTPTPMVSRVGQVLVSFTQPIDYYLAEGRNAYARAAATARLFDPPSHHTFNKLGTHFEIYLELVALVKRLLRDDPHVREVEGEVGA